MEREDDLEVETGRGLGEAGERWIATASAQRIRRRRRRRRRRRVGRARTQQPMVGVVRDLPFLSGVLQLSIFLSISRSAFSFRCVLHSEGGSGFERVSELVGFNLKARG